MRKKQNDSKVKKYVSEHKDNFGDSGSLGAYGGNNFANADAGKLKSDKFAVSKEAGKLWKEAETAHKTGLIKNGFASSGVWKAFIIFSALVILDYFLTVYAIMQHFSEFNPLTVSIYRNFQNPELIFFLFKSFVIGLNGLLVYLMLWLKKSKNIFGKIALAYALLVAFFAFAVVVYDIGIITGAFALPEFANTFILGFFRLFRMV